MQEDNIKTTLLCFHFLNSIGSVRCNGEVRLLGALECALELLLRGWSGEDFANPLSEIEGFVNSVNVFAGLLDNLASVISTWSAQF